MPRRSSPRVDHEPRRDGERIIVVGVDDSDSSWRAAAYAVGLARRQEARLVAVHVLPLHTTAALGGVAWMLKDADTERAERLRGQVAAGLGSMGETRALRWEFRVVPGGDTVGGLSRVADELHADMVVLGTARSRWHRMFGSAAVRMVRAGRWPVVVVP